MKFRFAYVAAVLILLILFILSMITNHYQLYTRIFELVKLPEFVAIFLIILLAVSAVLAMTCFNIGFTFRVTAIVVSLVIFSMWNLIFDSISHIWAAAVITPIVATLLVNETVRYRKANRDSEQ